MRGLHGYVGAGLVLIAVGCASAPPQSLTTQLARSDASIAQAEQAGAKRGEFPELQLAKDKRAHAQEALVAHKYELSMQLAEQSQVDAQYAGVKAQADQASDSIAEIKRSNDALRAEASRNSPQP